MQNYFETSTHFFPSLLVAGQHTVLKNRDFGKIAIPDDSNQDVCLNNWRMVQFKEFVEEHLKHSLLRILFSSFTHALRQSFAFPCERWKLNSENKRLNLNTVFSLFWVLVADKRHHGERWARDRTRQAKDKRNWKQLLTEGERIIAVIRLLPVRTVPLCCPTAHTLRETAFLRSQLPRHRPGYAC